MDAVAASDIEALKQEMIATARSRRNSRNGWHAGEHVIAAARAFYSRAVADGLIDASASPAHRVAKPRRLPSTRRALTPHELEEINAVTRTSGNDVILDALLLRLHTESACRRGGALALRLIDLDRTNGDRPEAMLLAGRRPDLLSTRPSARLTRHAEQPAKHSAARHTIDANTRSPVFDHDLTSSVLRRRSVNHH